MHVRICLFRFLVISVISPIGFDLANAQEQSDRQSVAEEVEEIVVYGEKTLVQLRAELRIAQDKAVSLFNSLNDDDDYDISCKKEAPTGSKIRRRVCRTQYERKATAAEARAFLLGVAAAPAWAEIQRKEKILHEKWNRLAIEQPEFLEVLTELAEAQQKLEAERKRRCEDRLFFCR